MSQRKQFGLQLIAPLFAGLLTWLFYTSLVPLFGKGEIYAFFAERGQYQHASVFFFLFGVVLLVLRWYTFGREKHSLEMKVPQGAIDLPAAGRMVESIPARFRDSLLGRRIVNLVKGFERGEDLGPLEDRLAEKDFEKLEQSANLVSWVRGLPPVIGLLGTLNGLRGGIAEIANLSGGQDINQLRSGLQNFAGHSSTAFDTTLLGITAALLLSAGLFFLREREDKHLAKVNSIAEGLARRFERPGRDVEAIERFSRSIVEAFATKVQTTMDSLLDRIDATMASRSGVFEASVAEAATRAVTQITQSADARFETAAGEWSAAWQKSLEKAAESLSATLAREQEHNAVIQQRLSATIRERLEEMSGELRRLATHVSKPQKFHIQLSSETDPVTERGLSHNHAALSRES